MNEENLVDVHDTLQQFGEKIEYIEHEMFKLQQNVMQLIQMIEDHERRLRVVAREKTQ